MSVILFRMNLRLLQSYWLFYLVVKEGSFYQKAASVASMCQPPLSMHIKKLEDSLGVKLFERSNKRLFLPRKAGQFFLL